MRSFYRLLSLLAAVLALGRGPGAFARNRVRRAAFRGMRKWF